MPWRLLPDPSAHEISRFRYTKRSRFLIDESLGTGTIEFFKDRHLNAVDVWMVGLNGRDDQTVFGYAWQHSRILLTHDEDFLDDRRFPEHRNPGLVVLPGANGNQTDMIRGLFWMTWLVGRDPGGWRKHKVRITRHGEIYIRSRNPDSGAMTTRQYRFHPRGAMELV